MYLRHTTASMAAVHAVFLPILSDYGIPDRDSVHVHEHWKAHLSYKSPKLKEIGCTLVVHPRKYRPISRALQFPLTVSSMSGEMLNCGMSKELFHNRY